MTCSPAHDWEWKNTIATPGHRREIFICRRCPMAKTVTSQVFDSEEAMYTAITEKTPQQKLAEEIEMEVMRGRST